MPDVRVLGHVAKEDKAVTAPGDIDLIDVNQLRIVVPSWPLSPWSTRALIRRKELGCVRIGRRLFVTRALLAEYIAATTEQRASTPG